MTQAITAVVVRDGIAKLTYRQVADELGCSDRMVVYYFPTKDDLVMAAVTALSQRMQNLLENAFGDVKRKPEELLQIAWPVFSKKEGDHIFRIFLEMIGLGAAQVEPFGTISRVILEEWATWLAQRVDAKSDTERRRQALGVMARIDGLLLIRHTLNAHAANEAARALMIRR